MCCILFVRRDLALVLLDDCLCHRKSYAITAREFSCFIGSVEAVKQAVHFKFTYCCIGIFHGIVQRFFFKDREEFWCVKLKGTLLGLVLIPVLFYTYNSVIGQSPDWINIAILFISAAIAYIYETRQFNNGTTPCKSPKIAFAVLCVIALLFVIFTFATPEIGIFKDPLTETYGING